MSYGTHVSDFRLPMPERHDVVLGHTGLGGYGRRSGGLLLYASALAIQLGDCVSPWRVVCPRGLWWFQLDINISSWAGFGTTIRS